MSNPFCNNILMTSFNNPKNILQDMHWFQRNTFVGPEINPERSYLKDLRHC